ncbi:hypothetical protein ACFLXC_04045 [Chloroflexota bacterium]
MKYNTLPKSELQKFKKVMPESKVLAEYKEHIKALQPDEIGHFTLSKGDVKPGTIKMRLLRAAKSLGLEIEVKRFGEEVVFYKTGVSDFIVEGNTKIDKVKN